MASEKYLEQRNSTYWYRRKVPLALIPRFNHRKEIRHSLGTSLRSEAVRLARIRTVELDQQFDQAMRKEYQRTAPCESLSSDPLSREDITFLHDRWVQSVVHSNDINRHNGFQDTSYEDIAENLTTCEPILVEARSRARYGLIDNAMTQFMVLNGYLPNPEDELYNELRDMFLGAVSKAHDVVKRRHQGEYLPSSAYVPPDAFNSPNPSQTTKDQVSLEEAYTLWEKQVRERQPKTTVDFKAVVRDFKKLNPTAAKDIKSITRAMVIDFRDHLSLTLQSKTVGKKVGLLRTILQVATDRELLPKNPASRISVAKSHNESEGREPYTIDDIKTILSSHLYKKEFVPSKRSGLAAARWLPLIAIFTGARLEEIAQLDVNDIRHDETYGYYIDINRNSFSEEHAKSLKTPNSKRIVPIHEQLINAGLIAYWERCKATGQVKLFPELKRSNLGKYSQGWSKWWGDFNDSIGITDRQKVFHSFRHGFIHMCRECEIGLEVHDALTGHTTLGVSSVYASKEFAKKALFSAMKRFSIGFNIMDFISSMETE